MVSERISKNIEQEPEWTAEELREYFQHLYRAKPHLRSLFAKYDDERYHKFNSAKHSMFNDRCALVVCVEGERCVAIHWAGEVDSGKMMINWEEIQIRVSQKRWIEIKGQIFT